MRPSNIPQECGLWDLSTTGYDAARARYTDYSGFGDHLAVSGAPSFNTRGGYPCVDLTGGFYAETLNDVAECTWLLAFRASLTGASVVNALESDATGVNANDHSYSTYADAFGAHPHYLLQAYNDNSVYFYNLADGGINTSKALGTRGTTQVAVIATSPATQQMKLQLNGGAVSVLSPDPFDETLGSRRWRLGNLASNLAGSDYFAGFNLRRFNGDMLATQGPLLAALVTGLLADFA